MIPFSKEKKEVPNQRKKMMHNPKKQNSKSSKLKEE
jgi:hypothetical protein